MDDTDLTGDRKWSGSGPISLGAIWALVLMVLPGVGLGFYYGGLGPWALAFIGLVVAFVIQTHRLPGMKAHLSRFPPQSHPREGRSE